MSRLLQNYDRLLARSNRRRLRWLLDGPLPADRRQSEIGRGLRISSQGQLISRHYICYVCAKSYEFLLNC